MARDRDIAAFDVRAPGYESGWLGRLHHQIADRTADLALTLTPAPRRILDVGCGTGYLLRQLAARCPQAELAGIDPAPAMIEAARAAAADGRLQLVAGTAEDLPWPAGTFDLVVSTTSFDHWADQRAAWRSAPGSWPPAGGSCSPTSSPAWLWPTLIGSRRDKARTTPRATRLLTAAGFQPIQWHDLLRRDHPRRRGTSNLGAQVTTSLTSKEPGRSTRPGRAPVSSPSCWTTVPPTTV